MSKLLQEFSTSAHRNSTKTATEVKLKKRCLKGFITYAHDDEKAKDELQKRLNVMNQSSSLPRLRRESCLQNS